MTREPIPWWVPDIRAWATAGMFILVFYVITLIAFVPEVSKSELFKTVATLLLGSGAFTSRGLAVISAKFGTFAAHGNTGFIYRGGGTQNSAVVGSVAIDHLMTDRVTLAAELLSEQQVGHSRLKLPAPVNYDYPFKRTINPTSIPVSLVVPDRWSRSALVDAAESVFYGMARMRKQLFAYQFVVRARPDGPR